MEQNTTGETARKRARHAQHTRHVVQHTQLACGSVVVSNMHMGFLSMNTCQISSEYLTPWRCSSMARSIVHTLRVASGASRDARSPSLPNPRSTICTHATPQSQRQHWLTCGAWHNNKKETRQHSSWYQYLLRNNFTGTKQYMYRAGKDHSGNTRGELRPKACTPSLSLGISCPLFDTVIAPASILSKKSISQHCMVLRTSPASFLAFNDKQHKICMLFGGRRGEYL